MYNLFLFLILQRPLPRRTFLLPDTKVPGGYDAVRCAGITTNEVLNLNKLQGTRLPSAFQLSFAPSAVYSLSVDIQNFLSHREGRTPQTRNGDMNIPGVEYLRAVNLFGSTRMRKVVAGAALFSRLRNKSSRAAADKIPCLNKRQRFSLPTLIFKSL